MDNSQSASQPSGERLALLYQLTQTFNSTLDLDEVLNCIMDEVIRVTRAERGFVMLHETDQGLVFRVARGIDQQTIEEPQFQISRSVVDRVAAEGKPVLTSDAQMDERFNIRQSVVFLKLRSILCVPLIVKGNVIGVIYVDNRLQAGIFSQDDLDLLNAIASSAAIAIDNARLYQLAIEKGRMERELQMARKVQTSLLPAETPRLPGWEFAAFWKPAREVGGDYYDFIPCKRGQMGVVIADVTDKGMPAALFMASTRSIFRASVYSAFTPAEGITQANKLVVEQSTDALFVTLFFARIAPDTGEVTYVNAGHNPPLFYSSNQSNQPGLQELQRTGIPIGVGKESIYEQRILYLNHEDFIVLYTDGVPDAINTKEEAFGTARLEQVILANRHADGKSMIQALDAAINHHTGSQPTFDDITIVVIKRL